MDFKNAPKKRTSNFREDETKLLIQLWGSPTVQNKLYLTHRKAPVMRLIAANMQKHGFYRTPDEIKTRIRNLKCLYHRIKKSMTTGAGIGTVDPDWPHYKSMDDILSKKNSLRQNLVYNHNLLSEVSEGSIKQEIEDIDVNDDLESYTSNSNGSDDEFDESSPNMPSITPLIIEEEEKPTGPIKIAPKPVTAPNPQPQASFPMIQIAQNLHATPQPNVLHATSQNSINLTNLTSLNSSQTTFTSRTVTANPNSTPANANKTASSMPFPLLILNGMPNGLQGGQTTAQTAGLVQKMVTANNSIGFNAEVSKILKEILDIQKENLEVERERLQVEKQKLEFERAIGSQLLNMVPTFNDIFQRISQPDEEIDTKDFEGHPNFRKNGIKGAKRPAPDPMEPLKNSKIFKEAVVNGIRRFMQDGNFSNSDNDNETDSGIANDSR